MSTDNSVEIAHSYRKVVVVPFETNNKLNDAKNKSLKENEYKKYSREGGLFCDEPADWVITADMDELIYHPDLVGVLSRSLERNENVAQVAGFNMYSPEPIGCGMDLIKKVRVGKRSFMFDKPILFSPDFDMTFGIGCHPHGDGYQKMFSSQNYRPFSETIYLLHYKHLGNRFVDVALQSAKRLSDENLSRGWGRYYLGTKESLEQKNTLLKTKSYDVISEEGDILYDVP